MNVAPEMDIDPRIEEVIEELKVLIRARYADARFDVVEGDDPEGIYLIAFVDVADREEVIDCYIDRLLDLQIDEELPLYVLPLRPLDRVLTAQYPDPPRASALVD